MKNRFFEKLPEKNMLRTVFTPTLKGIFPLIPRRYISLVLHTINTNHLYQLYWD